MQWYDQPGMRFEHMNSTEITEKNHAALMNAVLDSQALFFRKWITTRPG